MENEIILKPTFDAKTIFKASLSINANKKITAYFIALAVVFGINYYNSNRSDGLFFWITFTIILLLYGALVMYKTYSASKKQITSNPRIKENIIYTINNDFFQEKGESFDIKYFWKDVFKVVEKKDFFLIYVQKCVAKIIKKEDLKDNQYNELKVLFNSLDIKKSLK
jgi:uncharacterized protein YneF (UPF0154 family)